ncbi:MAG: Fic family protein [Gemmatimonadota bacterium]
MSGRRIPLRWQYDPRLNAPRRYQKACGYEAFVPDPLADLSLSLDAEIAGVVSEAEAAIGALNERARPALRPLARLLLRTESIASSKIEGMQIGARELARAETKADVGRKIGSTAREILANIDAMELAVDQAASADAFRVEDIQAIHRKLLEQSPNPRIAGRLRTEQNWIGGNDYNPCGADFVPPPPEYVEELLADLCAAINDDLLPPVVQAALVHAQFETIHPFADGNGRTGRAIIHVVLGRREIAASYVPPISVVLARSRERYIAGLVDFREDRIVRWIESFAAATYRAAALARAYLEEVARMTAGWREMLRAHAAPRSDAAAWALIGVLPAHPFITAPVAAAATGRSRPQVYRALEQLEESGVLRPLTAAKRGRAWEAVGLLDLLERLDSGEMPETLAAS